MLAREASESNLKQMRLNLDITWSSQKHQWGSLGFLVSHQRLQCLSPPWALGSHCIWKGPRTSFRLLHILGLGPQSLTKAPGGRNRAVLTLSKHEWKSYIYQWQGWTGQLKGHFSFLWIGIGSTQHAVILIIWNSEYQSFNQKKRKLVNYGLKLYSKRKFTKHWWGQESERTEFMESVDGKGWKAQEAPGLSLPAHLTLPSHTASFEETKRCFSSQNSKDPLRRQTWKRRVIILFIREAWIGEGKAVTVGMLRESRASHLPGLGEKYLEVSHGYHVSLRYSLWKGHSNAGKLGPSSEQSAAPSSSSSCGPEVKKGCRAHWERLWVPSSHVLVLNAKPPSQLAPVELLSEPARDSRIAVRCHGLPCPVTLSKSAATFSWVDNAKEAHHWRKRGALPGHRPGHKEVGGTKVNCTESSRANLNPRSPT